MRILLSVFFLLLFFPAFSQARYEDSLAQFVKNYVQTHEVVKGEDRKALQFYPVSKDLRVLAQFSKARDARWISFPTSGKARQVYRVYGELEFTLQGRQQKLLVYQSQDLMGSEQYKNYLFLPFTDSTSGTETYEGGRYIDLSTTDIHNNTLVLDFNKAYNPYCAYVSNVYNCPLPPKENALRIAIRAGEKAYAKAH